MIRMINTTTLDDFRDELDEVLDLAMGRFLEIGGELLIVC